MFCTFRAIVRDIQYEMQSREITLNAIFNYDDLSAAGEKYVRLGIETVQL